MNDYAIKVRQVLDLIDETQTNNITRSAQIIYNSVANDGVLHVFSTGHSHMIAEEFFYRAGGLIAVNPILVPFLMQHEGAVSSTKYERLSGIAEIVFSGADVRSGEPIIIASNSGINTVSIDMALIAKQNKNPVIAITSAVSSANEKSRHASGKKLFEVADVVIDTHVPKGDAVVKTGDVSTGAVSSIASLYVVQQLTVAVAQQFASNGITPPILKSANVYGGDEYNKELIKKYKNRVRPLY